MVSIEAKEIWNKRLAAAKNERLNCTALVAFNAAANHLKQLDLRKVNALTQQMSSKDVDRIAGAELGGIALAAATALETGKPFVIVRNAKKAGYGTGKVIEGKLTRGERVLLVEDIATSGGQAIEAAKTLRDAGAVVERVVATIDRQEGGREAIEAAGLRFDALFTTADLGIMKD